MPHYLTADSTRVDGRRYHYGDELPAGEQTTKLAERGLAVDSEDELNRAKVRRNLPYTSSGLPKGDEKSTLGLAQTTGAPGESAELAASPLGAEPAHVETEGEVKVPEGTNDVARASRGRGKAAEKTGE